MATFGISYMSMQFDLSKVLIIISGLFLSFAAVTKSYSQTCIVAVKSSNRIVVGADSKVLIITENKKTGEITNENKIMCKIFQHGSYNLAVAGTYGDIVMNTAAPIFDRKYSFDKTMKIFSDSFSMVLIKKINNTRKEYSELFKRTIEKNKGNFSSIVFFGIENDSLWLGVVRFHLVLNGENIKVSHEMGSGDIVTAGHTAEIDELLELQTTWEHGIESGIVRLINIASEAHPSSVGGPIDLIVVTKKETWWVNKKEMCK